MRKTMYMLLSLICVMALVGCSSNSQYTLAEPDIQEEIPSDHQDIQAQSDTMTIINIQIGSNSFTATLYENDATRALLEKFPLTLNMEDLNGNEKFYFFSENFPTESERVGNIETGDLMLYGSDCLVLFYESFSTSYSYTKLGSIEDVTGLADALGKGNVQVTFNLN
ncbi:cyclophilin-like fold protein [Irregularibacter muris]|uniref:Cyclophilin-like fold protein n=1 Tax=Irregularibacter muris TaxID=1796619 RepID=A0AAE3L032_9FIRM|nr:cyclophilin-like fold protein [Irregularibacter muris]MCR1900150.1 cyclophilin-like fold protein [Irregularibacter muris]